MGRPYLDRDAGMIRAAAHGDLKGIFTRKVAALNEVQNSLILRDVWDFGDVNEGNIDYTFPTSASIDRLSSSNAGDNQIILIRGLDTNGDELEQSLALNGQTPVNLATSLLFVSKLLNEGSVDLLGNVYCFDNAASGGVTLGVPNNAVSVKAFIKIGNGQSLMSMFKVPNNHEATLLEITASIIAKGVTRATILPFFKKPGGVFLKYCPFGANSNGTTTAHLSGSVPGVLEAMTEIKFTSEVDGDASGVSLLYDLLIGKITS